jgi:4-amino-4-deoxy-L-arabinose transferase-like glycosyltransferase
MNRTLRGAVGTLVCLLALAPLTPIVEAATVIHYQHESMQVFQVQLAHGEIRAATFNKKPHSLHLLLSDGRHVLAIYPPHNEPQLAAALEAKGVPVSIEKHKAKAAPVHHTLRYIAGGILVIVILAILAVLLVGRRRNLGQGEGEAGQTGEGQTGEASAAPPAAG